MQNYVDEEKNIMYETNCVCLFKKLVADNKTVEVKEIIERYINVYPNFLDYWSYIYAIQKNNLKILVCLNIFGVKASVKILKQAIILNASLDIVKYLIDVMNVEHTLPEYISHCCMVGNLKILEFLFERECECDKWALEWACIHGHLHIVIYLLKNLKSRLNRYTIYNAVQSKNIEIIKFLAKSVAYSDDLITHACRHGNLEIVSYLYEHRTNVIPFESPKAIQEALLSKNRDTALYLINKNFPFTIDECKIAYSLKYNDVLILFCDILNISMSEMYNRITNNKQKGCNLIMMDIL